MPLTYTKDAFAQALQDAASAHGVYEEALGQGRDEDWPLWYARQMARQPTEVGVSPVLTFASPGELAEALLRAEAAHAPHGDAEPEWARWYTEHLTRERARGGSGS